MSDLNFLKSFLTEDLYIIKEDQTKSVAPAAEKKAATKAYEEKEEPSQNIVINEPVEEAKSKAFPPHQGSFNKKILIAVKDNDNEFISDTDLDFLLKILGAVKLTIDDVAIINTLKNEIELSDLKNWAASHYLGFTGEHISQQGSDFYTPTVMAEINCLSCNKLSEIAADKSKKQQLWTALQQLFLK